MSAAEKIEAAFKLRERDLRARMLADSAVAIAMQEYGDRDVEERDFRRYAHDIARLATTILVSGIYINDAELVALKEERDRYKKLAEEGLMMMPPRIVLTNPA